MTELVLIRGLPGSGKTTLAHNRYAKYDHFEADMYFVIAAGEYKFNPKLIGQAHAWCQEQTYKSLAAGHNVVVTNTFTQLWELEPYFKIAAGVGGVTVKVIKCTGKFCNTHSVPPEGVKRMAARWQDVEGEEEYSPLGDVQEILDTAKQYCRVCGRAADPYHGAEHHQGCIDAYARLRKAAEK